MTDILVNITILYVGESVGELVVVVVVEEHLIKRVSFACPIGCRIGSVILLFARARYVAELGEYEVGLNRVLCTN
jgi:hypothetical protein